MKYSELNDQAKAKVLDSFASTAFNDSFSWEHIYDDAKHIGELMGISIDNISFSGFSHQGSFASYSGSYAYRKGTLASVKAYAPKDTDLHDIAKALQDIQKRHFYRLIASISESHYYGMTYSIEDSENPYKDIGDDGWDLKDTLNDFAHWIYRQLESAYEYETSEEYIVENIEANDYDFSEDGDII
jgi:hypothetical protein